VSEQVSECPSCGCKEWYPTLNRKCVSCGTYLDGPTEIKTYDPKDVKVTFNGVELTGFADGTFISVDPAAPDSDRTAFTRAKVRDGTCTFTLLQEGQSDLVEKVYDDVQVRHWNIDVEAYFTRCRHQERKRRRRARALRKKRRGWA